MNRHVNKNKSKKPTPQNIGVQQVEDQMPKEVAESMLLTPGTRLTNRMRKNCLAARQEDYFCSTLEPKSLAVYLGSKFKTATAAQLAKWAVRVFKRRSAINRSIQKYGARLAALPEDAKASRTLLTAVLNDCNQRAVQCDTTMAALKVEAESRLNGL